MRKLLLPILLLAAVILAACAPAATPAPTATPVPTQPPVPTSGPASCTVESTLPKPDPADAARFAPVTEKDWIQGSPDARITLLEYSDFM